MRATNHSCQRAARFMVTKSEQLEIHNQATAQYLKLEITCRNCVRGLKERRLEYDKDG